MLATLLQQWARRYIRTTQFSRRSAEKRARMHAFFANGVDRFHLAWAVEALPALVHLSLFIFFTGLLVFLFNINHTIFSAVVCWVALSSAAYTAITLMPVFWPDSPYYAPLSSTSWLLYSAIPYALFKLLTFIPRKYIGFSSRARFHDLADRYRGWVLGGIEKAAEELASKLSPDLDSRVIEWTVETLNEDEGLENFFESIPGFYTSGVVNYLQGRLPVEAQKKIVDISSTFVQRTLSSSLVSESVTLRRLATSLEAADVIGGTYQVAGILQKIFFWDWNKVLYAVEIGHFLRQWDIDYGGMVTYEVQSIIACIISDVLKRGDRWKALTLDHLDVSEGVLEEYLAHGDSLQLANFLHFLHRTHQRTRCSNWAPFRALQSLSEFDIQNTLPDLQQNFCGLWNEIVGDALDNGARQYPVRLLLCTRRLYTALHRDTDAAPTAFSNSTSNFAEIMFQPSSYPLCNIPGHLSGLVSQVHDLEAAEAPHMDRSTPLTSIRYDPIPAAVSPLTGPEEPSSPTSNLDSTTSHPPEGPSLGDEYSPIATSSRHQQRHALPLPSVPVTLSDSGNATQNTGGHPTISSTSNSNLRSPPVAPTCTPQLASTLIPTSTISPQLHVDHHATPPSTLPGTSTSSASIVLPPPRRIPSADLQPFTTSSAPHSDQ